MDSTSGSSDATENAQSSANPVRASLIRRQSSILVQQELQMATGVVAEESEAVTLELQDKEKKHLILNSRLFPPIAGFCSAAIEITCVWPFEYSKTQLQLNRKNPNFKILNHIKERGVRIYQGLAPMLIGAPLQGMLRFTILDFFNRRLKNEETGKITVFAGLAAGIATGIVESCLVVTPMETVKTKLIDQKKGLRTGVASIIEIEGYRGLYKGLSATIAKSASNQCLRFFIFNQYKNFILESPTTEKLKPGQALTGGMLAGFLGALGNTPIDTVKSRLQGLDGKRYKGLFHCMKLMVREEGFFSLYKGLLSRLGRVLPGQGVIFCSYEVITTSLYKNFT